MRGKILYEKAQLIADKMYSMEIGISLKESLYKEYISLIRKSAYKGYPAAQYDLAQSYEDVGFWGVPNPYENIQKRFYWYSKAAFNNYAAAYNNLADMFERGIGHSKDIKKALEYYKKAADLGDKLGKKNYKILTKQIEKGETHWRK